MGVDISKKGKHDTRAMTPEQIAALALSATIKVKEKPKKPAKPKAAPKPEPKSKIDTSNAPKVGRPSDYSQGTADLICEALAEGHSLRAICAAENMPSKAAVFRWLAAHQEFRDQYARAREAQADCLFDDMIDIADDGRNDTYSDDNGNERTDHDVIARSKLRVETRKWMAGKLKPKVYGDKIDLNHGGQKDNPIQALLQQVSGSSLPVVKDDGAE